MSIGEARTQQLEERLSRDPYDFSALFEKMIAMSAMHQRDSAVDLYAKLSPLLGISQASLLLKTVVHDATPVILGNGIYAYIQSSIDDSSDNKTVYSTLVRSCPPIVQSVAKFLGCPTAGILMVDGSNYAHSHQLTNGFGIVALSQDSLAFLPSNDALLKSEVAHEVAHCVLSSGHPFLDEGLATFAQVLLESNWCLSEACAVATRKVNLGCDTFALSLFLGRLSQMEWSRLVKSYGDRASMYDIASAWIAAMFLSFGSELVLEFVRSSRLAVIENALEEHFYNTFGKTVDEFGHEF